MKVEKEKVIKGLECFAQMQAPTANPCKDCGYIDRPNFAMCVKDVASDALNLLKKQEAKKPIHFHQEYSEHDWVKDEDGEIDEWAISYEYCNGPMCKRCYYSFCIHCNPNGWNNVPCVLDFYKCPSCEKKVIKNIKFCDNCGQEVKWDD